MKTKEEVKGCFNCEHEKMNHKSCNASKPCLKGSQWTKRIAPPQEVERAKVETCNGKCEGICNSRDDLHIYVNGDGLNIEYNPNSYDSPFTEIININYCPFCGKKIERV